MSQMNKWITTGKLNKGQHPIMFISVILISTYSFRNILLYKVKENPNINPFPIKLIYYP